MFKIKHVVILYILGIIFGALFLDIWSSETSIKKGLIAMFWTALFLVALIFVEKNKEGPFALKASYNYFSELLESESFFVDISILDFDSKRVHVFGEMRKDKSLELSAVFETVLMNMDLSARKVKQYPDRVLELFKLFKSSLDQNKIPLEIGRKITLKK